MEHKEWYMEKWAKQFIANVLGIHTDTTAYMCFEKQF